MIYDEDVNTTWTPPTMNWFKLISKSLVSTNDILSNMLIAFTSNMNIFDEPLAIDRSEKNTFSYSEEEVKDMIEAYQEFDRQQIIAEYEAVESARALILTDWFKNNFLRMNRIWGLLVIFADK